MTYGIVYGLYDPRDGALRYVGQTTLSLERRLSSHLSPANLKRNCHSACWLRSLVRRGVKPVISVFGAADSREDLDALEITTISESRARGCRLTNFTPGGCSPSGYRLSDDTRAKMARARKGHAVSPETRAKIASARRGRRLSESQLKATVLARRSLETLRLIDDAVKSLPEVPREEKKGEYLGPLHPAYRRDISTDAILEKLRSGCSRKQVAGELGVTPRFICKRLQQARNAGVRGVPKSNRGVTTNTILRKMSEGKSRKQAALELGISLALVSLRLRSAREQLYG
jgi:predicted transcriptional regulator